MEEQSVIPMRVVAQRLQEIEEQIRSLMTERDMLTTLARHAVVLQDEEAEETGEGEQVQIEQAATATDTVLNFIRKYPGQTSGEVADAFERSNLKIGGSDPRKTVQTIIGALVQKRRLRRDERTGRLSVAFDSSSRIGG